MQEHPSDRTSSLLWFGHKIPNIVAVSELFQLKIELMALKWVRSICLRSGSSEADKSEGYE